MNYLKCSKEWPKKVSWPNRQDYSPNKWLVLTGVVSAVLIAIVSLGWGIPVVAMLGMMEAAIVAGTVPFPALKVGGKLIAKIVLTVLGLIADMAFALPRLFLSRRKGKLAEEAAPDEAVPLDNDHPAAPAIQSSELFLKYLAQLKTTQGNKLTENKSKDDSNKTVSASVTLDTDGLADTKSTRTFTISEVEGKTVFKLDLPPKGDINSEDRIKLLEKMCRTAINNELPESAFQVHPSMGTLGERKELQEILDKVRADKVTASLVEVPITVQELTASEQAKKRGPPPAARSRLMSQSLKDPVQAAVHSVVEQNQEAARESAPPKTKQEVADERKAFNLAQIDRDADAGKLKASAASPVMLPAAGNSDRSLVAATANQRNIDLINKEAAPNVSGSKLPGQAILRSYILFISQAVPENKHENGPDCHTSNPGPNGTKLRKISF